MERMEEVEEREREGRAAKEEAESGRAADSGRAAESATGTADTQADSWSGESAAAEKEETEGKQR